MTTILIRVAVVALCVATACVDATPIGSIECIGDRIRCGRAKPRNSGGLPLVASPSETVSSTGLNVLTPTWSGHPLGTDYDKALLAVDADGDLWTLVPTNWQIVLTKIDASGALVDEYRIDAPKSLKKPERYSPGVVGIQGGRESEFLAAISVVWERLCDAGDGPEPECPAGQVFDVEEVLAFDDFSTAPRRTQVPSEFSQPLQANASGAWRASNGHVDKYDRKGKLVWRQTGLLPESDSSPWELRAALRPHNELSVLVWRFDSAEIPMDSELWHLDARGNIDTSLSVAWPGHGEVKLAADARGRDVLAGINLQGDMVIMRMLDDGDSESSLVTREEFTELTPDDIDIDSESAFYVIAPAGGRVGRERREILCQRPATGSTRCFTLSGIESDDPRPLVDDMVVAGPGVVYVSSPPMLRRYELPAQ